MLTTPGGNALLDLRSYTSPSQVDVYQVGIALDETDTSWAFPIVYSWPNLNPYYSGSVRLKCDINGSVFDVDMKAQTSYTLDHYPFPSLQWVMYVYIVAEGPIPGASLPIVSTYGVGYGGFRAIVHATGAPSAIGASTLGAAEATTTWFEYGPTRSYGASTTPQSITGGTSASVWESFDPQSLPMNSRLHLRAVAQNSSGTFYGGDRIVSNGTPPPELPADSSGYVKYRTAIYRDWADAKDQKDKRKSVKCKPDKVFFKIDLVTPASGTAGSPLKLDFSMDVTGVVYNASTGIPPKTIILATFSGKKAVINFDPPLPASRLQIDGIGNKGKQIVTKFAWGTDKKQDVQSLHQSQAQYLQNQPRLPMPNLHNVGEDIYGGVMQTLVQLTVGMATGPHSVYLPKYKDVLKSLVKEKKGGDIYHTALPHCLNTFDKNKKEILKAQKGLPPDKHNNVLFAEQLTLKLNIAASDSAIFPHGLGELIYGNGTPFDNETVREIALQVDSFLSCPPVPPKGVGDSSVYLKVVQDINTAFNGPMDTASWSCDNLVCTGVKMLMDVPYLRANPNAVPIAFAPRHHYSANLGPEQYALHQNYPNPFNPTTTISFDLKQEALVTLKVYNTLGQEVKEPVHNELMDEGEQELEFDASSLASGVYYYKIVAQEIDGSSILFSNTKKMLLLK